MKLFNKQSLVFTFFLLYCVTNSLAQDKLKITFGPYLQQVSETSATFIWQTNEESVGWVEIAPDDATHFYAAERPQYFNTYLGKKYIGNLHTVTINNLKPGTTYRYRAFSQQVSRRDNDRYVFLTYMANTKVYKVEPLKFTTLDTQKETIAFAMINDIHENNELQTSLLDKVKDEDVDFVVFNGDMSNDIRTTDKIIDGYMKTATNLFASEIPLFMVRGNHEPRGVGAQEFMNFFPSPTGLPYYSFKHGNTFFIALDCGEDKTDPDVEYDNLNFFDEYRIQEVAWLKELVQSEDFKGAKRKIVFLHMPPLTDHWHGPAHLDELFVPILNDANIDLMLSGHLHRHWYIEPNYQNCNFPVLVNSNKHKTRVEISDKHVDIKVSDDQGKVVFEKTLK